MGTSSTRRPLAHNLCLARCSHILHDRSRTSLGQQNRDESIWVASRYSRSGQRHSPVTHLPWVLRASDSHHCARSFHAIYFPAFLMALNLPLPRGILCHAHWTMNRQKMSKSVGNVVSPFEVMEKYDIDTVRWYLARNGGNFVDDVGTVPVRRHRS
jgi:tRNA synthetases class I (M)